MCRSAPSRVYITGSAKGGTTEDFDGFFRTQFPTVARSLGLVIGDREEGNELAQEAFARAWARWDRYESPEHARNSILRIGINLARSQTRMRKRVTDRSGRSLLDESHPFDGENVLSRIEIVEALRALTDRQRTCVVLTDYVGMDSREVARLLRIPAGSVRTHVTRGRQRLRTLLEHETRGMNP